MEANKNGVQNQDDNRSQNNENKEPYIGADKEVDGKDITVEGREERRHHQEFGNRKYESNTNHSSADDQPTTNTGPGNF
jgi:hypothetical protein